MEHHIEIRGRALGKSAVPELPTLDTIRKELGVGAPRRANHLSDAPAPMMHGQLVEYAGGHKLFKEDPMAGGRNYYKVNGGKWVQVTSGTEPYYALCNELYSLRVPVEKRNQAYYLRLIENGAEPERTEIVLDGDWKVRGLKADVTAESGLSYIRLSGERVAEMLEHRSPKTGLTREKRDLFFAGDFSRVYQYKGHDWKEVLIGPPPALRPRPEVIAEKAKRGSVLKETRDWKESILARSDSMLSPLLLFKQEEAAFNAHPLRQALNSFFSFLEEAGEIQSFALSLDTERGLLFGRIYLNGLIVHQVTGEGGVQCMHRLAKEILHDLI